MHTHTHTHTTIYMHPSQDLTHLNKTCKRFSCDLLIEIQSRKSINECHLTVAFMNC